VGSWLGVTYIPLPSTSSSLTVPYPTTLSAGFLSKVRAPILVLRLLGHQLSVEDEFDDIPDWVGTVAQRLAQLEQLRPGWDSYGGRPLNRRHSVQALNFLGQVMADGTSIPDVVPLADGGVQLEWRRPGLEVDFVSDDESEKPLLLVSENQQTTEYTSPQAINIFRNDLRTLLAAEDSVSA
jgi:hypothetical protein